MRVTTIVQEDMVNYKKPSMFIGTISCCGKCCLEAGIPLSECQNYDWKGSKTIEVSGKDICHRYIDNPITEAIVIGGLEPFEQFNELYSLIFTLRITYNCNDDVVIYTGYNPDEIKGMLKDLSAFENIIIKFGRYVPNASSRYDDILGVTLASDNQYGMYLSDLPIDDL